MLLQQIIQSSSISMSTFCWAIGLLIGIIIGLVAFIGRFIMKFNDAMNTKFEVAIKDIKDELKEEVEDTTASHEKIEGEMKEIKDNYLSRFDKIYKLINEGNTSLLKNITELRLEVAHIKK